MAQRAAFRALLTAVSVPALPASICDVNVLPKTCVSLQTECPGIDPSCPAALQEPAPTKQSVCSTGDIQNAAAGCAGGPDTAGCNAFFNFEATSNLACVKCLQAFSYDFVDGTGICSPFKVTRAQAGAR